VGLGEQQAFADEPALPFNLGGAPHRIRGRRAEAFEFTRHGRQLRHESEIRTAKLRRSSERIDRCRQPTKRQSGE